MIVTKNIDIDMTRKEIRPDGSSVWDEVTVKKLYFLGIPVFTKNFKLKHEFDAENKVAPGFK